MVSNGLFVETRSVERISSKSFQSVMRALRICSLFHIIMIVIMFWDAICLTVTSVSLHDENCAQ